LEEKMRGIVICVLAAAAGVWAAETVVLESDGDSYVWYEDNGVDWPPLHIDENFGSEPLMGVLLQCWAKGLTQELQMSYMHFDFSGLGEYDAADLVEAQLVLRVAHAALGEDQRAYVVTEPWLEMNITFNNRPERGELLAIFHLDVDETIVDLDVGPIAPWVDAPETAYGIHILDYDWWEGDSATPGRIYTRESDYAPELRLTFSGPAVEESSWGNIKASF
jgi:hypothetical protein